MDLWLYINGCYSEAGRAHDEDLSGRRWWYKEILKQPTPTSRVEKMALMESLLGLS